MSTLQISRHGSLCLRDRNHVIIKERKENWAKEIVKNYTCEGYKAKSQAGQDIIVMEYKIFFKYCKNIS